MKGIGPETATGSYTRGSIGMRYLREMNLAPSEGIPVFAELACHPVSDIAVEAIEQLTSYGAAAAIAVPSLLRVVKSRPNSLEQEYAIGALAALGPKASDAVSALTRIVANRETDPDPWAGAKLREKAAAALGSIGAAAVGALPAMERQAYVLASESYSIPMRQGPSTSAGREDSLGGLDDVKFEARARTADACLAAYSAIAEISKPIPLESATLRRLGEKAFSGVAGMRAFATLDANLLPRVQALQLLARFLDSEAPLVERVRAVALVGRLEPEAPELVRRLFWLAQSTDSCLASAARSALCHVRPSNPETMRMLVDVIRDPVNTGKLMRWPISAAYLSRYWLLEPADTIVIAGCGAMHRYGRDRKAAVPALLSQLNQVDSNTSVERLGAFSGWLPQSAPRQGVPRRYSSNCFRPRRSSIEAALAI